MKASEVREKYLKFFEARGHKIIPPAPLVLENDPTTLFTSSGMQPLVPYLMGEPHPEGKRLVDSQPAVRTIDIDEVGDNRHLTYFEMLGNWSLGDYFKKEQLAWCLEFFTEELGLSKDRLWISVFEGTKEVPKDTESLEIWKSLSIPEKRIYFYGVDKNWWSRSGPPENMPEGEIGGPDSEIFLEFPDIKHDSKFGKECHPNCDCGRFIEIGNSVFIQYKKQNGKLVELPQKNVDFGGGLERIAAALNGDSDVFKTDIYKSTIDELERVTGKSYPDNERTMRVIADHVRAANALSENGVVPANKQQGYVMRRLIRRAALKMRDLKPDFNSHDFELITKEKTVIEEIERFKRTLDAGIKEASKIEKIDGKKAFDLYQTYGFPLELTIEIFSEKGQEINKDEFQKEFEKHKEKSRTASAGMFKGGLADHSETVIKYHTATHLLQQALRDVLGDMVHQAGSNITAERLRFDFTFNRKLTAGEVAEVEGIINAKIKEGLTVTKEIMPKEKALKEGALAFFPEKYPETTSVYTIGGYSKELCGGPHVSRTSEISNVRIIKEEAAGAGLRRIYAKLA